MRPRRNRHAYPERLMSMHQPPGDRPGPIGILARIGGIVAAAIVAGLLLGFMLMPFVGGAGVLTRDVVKLREPPRRPQHPAAGRSARCILASDGSVLATLYYQNRVEVPLTSISPVMRQATVAIEDSRFLDHHGVDFRGVVRSLATNASAGGVEQGSSTLTMQYVKNVLVNQATTADELDAARGDSSTRKLREIRYALGLEKIFTQGRDPRALPQHRLLRRRRVRRRGRVPPLLLQAGRRPRPRRGRDPRRHRAAADRLRPAAQPRPQHHPAQRRAAAHGRARLRHPGRGRPRRPHADGPHAPAHAHDQRVHVLLRPLLLRLRRADDPSGPDVRRHPRGARGLPAPRRLHDPHDPGPEGAERRVQDGQRLHPHEGPKPPRHRHHHGRARHGPCPRDGAEPRVGNVGPRQDDLQLQRRPRHGRHHRHAGRVDLQGLRARRRPRGRHLPVRVHPLLQPQDVRRTSRTARPARSSSPSPSATPRRRAPSTWRGPLRTRRTPTS